jgi:hypothetical protein
MMNLDPELGNKHVGTTALGWPAVTLFVTAKKGSRRTEVTTKRYIFTSPSRLASYQGVALATP